MSSLPTDTPHARSAWTALLALGGFLLAGLGMYVLWTHDPNQPGFFPPCLFHTCTGIYCPGCGSTRAAHALLHGDVLGAMRKNLFLVVAGPFLLYWLLSRASGVFFGRRFPERRLSGRTTWLIALLVIGYWIARNIPCYPFELLAPH